MEPTSALAALLSTALGKAAAGAAVAAVSLGGLAAADVVDLPLQANDRPADVTTSDTELPTEAESGDDVANDTAAVEAKKADAQAKREAAQENRRDGETTDDEGGEPNEHADFGQSVADVAQAEDATGQDVAEHARTENPGTEARQDADVRQDTGAEDDAETGEQPPADAGSQADQYRPADAGSQAERGR
jgi:hypothetical protein